jgi:YggT family protein
VPERAGRGEPAEEPVDYVVDYVNALTTVFFLVILGRIVMSFLPMAPISRRARAFYDFFHSSTEWFLGFFRRIIPPLGMFDLSPVAALFVLFISNWVVVNLLQSL